jgi:hypothetical protein
LGKGVSRNRRFHPVFRKNKAFLRKMGYPQRLGMYPLRLGINFPPLGMNPLSLGMHPF